MTKLDRQTYETRIHETARSIADLGPMEARIVMRQRYAWSQRTWQRYFNLALTALRANRMCADAERDALIAATEGIMRDPAAGPGTRKSCIDILAKLKGAYAPTLQDIRQLTLELPANVRALLARPSALRNALAEDIQYLSLDAPTALSTPLDDPTAPLAADLPPR